MRKTKSPALITTLRVVAAILAAYSIWALVYSVIYIWKGISSGQLPVTGNVYNIGGFFMSNFGQWVVLSLIVYALSRVLNNENTLSEVLNEGARSASTSLEVREPGPAVGDGTGDLYPADSPEGDGTPQTSDKTDQ